MAERTIAEERASTGVRLSSAGASVELPDIHADPADRIIIATALDLSCLIVSKDQVLADYPGVRVIW